MRNLMNKLMTGSMIVGAALVVSACGGTENADAVDNTTVTSMDSMEPVDGTTNDMTAMDGAGGTGNMSADANMSMESMKSEEMKAEEMKSDAMKADNLSANVAAGNLTNAL